MHRASGAGQMERWHKIVFLLAVMMGHGFTWLCMYGASMDAIPAVHTLCRFLLYPGLASFYWVSDPLGRGGDSVLFLMFTINTVIWSLPFGVLLWLLHGRLFKSRNDES